MILLYLLVPAAYLAAAVLEWNRIAPRTAGVTERAIPASHWLVAFALAGHAVLVDGTVATSEGLDVSLVNALSATAGLTALFAWAGSLTRALPGILAVALAPPSNPN